MPGGFGTSSFEGAGRGLGGTEAGWALPPWPPTARPPGSACLCFCCCQAVGERPARRARWPYMVREREGGWLLAQEGKGGYRAPCTALIAPSAIELLQLLCWISADKKGALDRAGIQLADGCGSPARCYSAPPEPDLIWTQPPAQPTPAASSPAAPGWLLRARGSPCVPSPQFVPGRCPQTARVDRAQQCPPKLAPAASPSVAGPRRCLREPAPIAPADEAASSSALGPTKAGSTFPEPDLFIVTSCIP